MDDPQTSTPLPFMDAARLNSRPLLEQRGATDLLYSLGTAHPGTVTLHNHPRFMQRLVRTEDDGLTSTSPPWTCSAPASAGSRATTRSAA